MAPVPINNSDSFKKNIKPNFINLKLVKRHLDRIQLSIRDTGNIYNNLIAEFKSVFKYLGPIKPKKSGNKHQLIQEYCHKRISIRIIRYFGVSLKWFSILIFNPDKEIQEIVCNILTKLIPDREIRNMDVSVTQVEFALDIYPESLKDLYQLESVLSHSVVLNHSRRDAYNECQDTQYQGKKGDVRKGSKGLTCYLKPINAPIKYRIELRANKKLLKKRKINILSLPILADTIDIFDFITFKCGLNSLTLSNLARAKNKKQRPNFQQSPLMRKIMRAHISESLIFNKISEDGLCSVNFQDAALKPVAYQISYFKKLKTKWKFTNQIDQFFPINEQIKEDMQNMRIRRDYSRKK